MKTFARQCYFSLIELLVVVAIIGILTSMLLPALKKARDHAKRISCQSNIKQSFMGFLSYSEDYDGYSVAWHTGSGTGGLPWHYYLTSNPYDHHRVHGYINAFLKNGWYATAANQDQYLTRRKMAGVLACPSVTDWKTYVLDYGPNSWLREWAGTHYSSNADMDGYLRVARIKRPSGAAWLSEPRNTFYVSYTNEAGLAQDVLFRHAGGASVVFADGHAAWRRRGEIVLRLPASERP